MTAVPMQMINPPVNMPARRPKRSLEEGKFDHVGRSEGNVVVRAGGGKESTDHSTDAVHGEDNTGHWILWWTGVNISINHSWAEHRHTLAEVAAIGKAFHVCPHTIDTNPGRRVYNDKASRGARPT